MANFTDKIKTTWFKCVETLGQSAANLADNAKQKLSEINMEARRKEVVADLPAKLMQMWKDGVELPEELNQVLTELNGLEEELAAARAARLAKKMKPAITDGSDAEQPEEEKADPVAQTSDTEAEETAEDVAEPAADEANAQETEAAETPAEATDENAPSDEEANQNESPFHF